MDTRNYYQNFNKINMAKIKREKTENNISQEMIKNIKKEILSFGVNSEDYIRFLISVNAMKDKDTVRMYDNSQIETYRNAYLRKHEVTVEDSMQLDKFKILSSDSEGNTYETGYFTPRSFWDFYKNYKLSSNR